MNGPPDPVLAALHWVEYLGLLGGLGSIVVRRLGRMRPQVRWAEPPMHVAFAGALVGGVGLLALGPSWLLFARVVAEGVTFVLCVRGIPYVAVFAVLAALLVPFTGHAADVQPQPVGAEFADALHVLSAGIWAGGILALASLRPPGGWKGEEGRTLLERFGRVALLAFALTALTGLLRATEQMRDLSDLWTTAYGLVLVLKSLGILIMLALSPAWRRGWPVTRAEAALVVIVVAATALLATFPLTAIG